MYIIVGLGNPTREYEGTRHNIGFEAIEAIAKTYQITMDTKKHKAICGKGMIGAEKVILAMPQTYMNLSGESVRELADFYKVSNEEIIILYDDISLDVGALRLRKKGSAGGHNGIKSIMACLGTNNFNRLKIGIRHPENESVVSWVLSPFNNDQQKLMDAAFETSENVINDFIKGKNAQYLMNQYN